MKITSALPDPKGRAEPCPYGKIIILYHHAILVPYP